MHFLIEKTNLGGEEKNKIYQPTAAFPLFWKLALDFTLGGNTKISSIGDFYISLLLWDAFWLKNIPQDGCHTKPQISNSVEMDNKLRWGWGFAYLAFFSYMLEFFEQILD